MIELLEVTDPEARRSRLPEGAQASVEHIALRVSDLAGAARELEGHGVELKSPSHDGALTIGPTRNLWSVAQTSAGIAIQLVEYGHESTVNADAE